MKVSINWINDFTALPNLPPQELGQRFTLGCAEVEEVTSMGLFWSQLKIAQITQIEPHPEADKLRLVTFEFGDIAAKRVVCGAANVRVGLKTVYAPLGVTLPIGLTLEPKKIRGVLSEGMLCSEEELGLAEESAGIIELDENSPVGQTLKDYWSKTSDIVIDIDNKSLTHRPDLWGHYGLAREFSALFSTPLKNPYDQNWAKNLKAKIGQGPSPIKVRFDGESAALGYFGLSIDGVSVAPSPAWMQERLNACGLRPINNMVDISNYIMLELGIPLHIFDRHQIQGHEVVISKLKNETNFQTLDENWRELIAGDTVISDETGPLVLAGIMGGLKSGVNNETTQLFIEVANWKAAMVRHTSTRLGLRTDSSQRYEKSLDSQLLERTLLRTLELILKLCPEAKVVGQVEYAGVNLEEFKPLQIELDPKRAQAVLGTPISPERINEILTSLDFQVNASAEKFMVTVPSWRSTKDIEFEADLIEELGRVIGYDHIEPRSPLLNIAPVRLSVAQELHRKIRDFMLYHSHAFEVMTYPLVGEKLLNKSNWPSNSELTLINSLSIDHNQMRPSLIPSMLESCALNAKNFSEFHTFELGRSYHQDNKNFASEESTLAVALYDKEQSTFHRLLNSTERLLASINAPADFCERDPKFKNQLVDESWTGLHPFEFINIRLMGKMSGVIFSVHPLMMRNFKIKGHLSFMLLNLNPLEARPMKEKFKYNSLPKFPGSQFDWTVTTAHQTPMKQVFDALKSVKLKELQEVKVVDVFHLNDQDKAITLRASFLDPEKTLSGDFLTGARQSLVDACQKAGFPLRA